MFVLVQSRRVKDLQGEYYRGEVVQVIKHGITTEKLCEEKCEANGDCFSFQFLKCEWHSYPKHSCILRGSPHEGEESPVQEKCSASGKILRADAVEEHEEEQEPEQKKEPPSSKATKAPTLPQQTKLYGKVIDATTGKGVSGVSVELLEGETKKPVLETDENGSFEFGKVKPGKYKLCARKPKEYVPEYYHLEVVSAQPREEHVFITPPLPADTIRAVMWYSEVSTPPGEKPNATLSMMHTIVQTPVKYHEAGTRGYCRLNVEGGSTPNMRKCKDSSGHLTVYRLASHGGSTAETIDFKKLIPGRPYALMVHTHGLLPEISERLTPKSKARVVLYLNNTDRYYFRIEENGFIENSSFYQGLPMWYVFDLFYGESGKTRVVTWKPGITQKDKENEMHVDSAAIHAKKPGSGSGSGSGSESGSGSGSS